MRYDLNLTDFVPTAKLRIKRNAENETLAEEKDIKYFDSVFNSGMYLPFEIQEKGHVWYIYVGKLKNTLRVMTRFCQNQIGRYFSVFETEHVA